MKLFDLAVEKGVLGCLLIDNALISKAKADIKTSYFSSHIHARLYDEILESYKQRGIADLVVLKGVDTEIMADIMNFVPSITSFEHYKTELINFGIKRELLTAVDESKGKILNSLHIAPDVLKTEILNRLNDVRVNNVREDNTSISDVLSISLNSLEAKHNQKNSQYKRWGIKWLDEKTGGVKPALTYLAARPSIGKTAFALQIAKNVAMQGGKTAIFSLEMDKKSVCNRIICNVGEIDKNYFDKEISINSDAWAEIGKASGKIAELPLFIYDSCFSIEEILLNCEEQRAKQGLDFLIIDYIQLCESTQKHSSTNERISYISRQLKKYQQKTGIHVLALSQFNRAMESKDEPSLSNLRDSGSLEQDANNVFFLHERHVESEKTGPLDAREIMLIIAKQREGERNTSKKLKFYGVTQRFYE